jgi:hypothetical protein
MNTTHLKNLVIDRIYNLEDDELLAAIKLILDKSQNSDNIYQLNAEQEEHIYLAKEQIATGKYFSNEDIDKEEDAWLKE